MSKTLRESEVERLLINWAMREKNDYTRRLRYKSHSPEQSIAGGSGIDTSERNMEILDALCNEEMKKIKNKDPDMYRVAIFEFSELEPWIARCRRNRGWSEDITGVWHSVHKPYKSHFLESVKVNCKIMPTDYYNKLSRLKKLIGQNLS